MIKIKIYILLCFLLVFLQGQFNILRNKRFRVINYSATELTNLRIRLNRGFHILTFTNYSLNMTGLCNSCNFKILRFSGNSIDLSNGTCTLMFCEGTMQLEQDLTSVINNANRIALRGKYLIIDAGGRKIRAEMI